MQKRLSELVQTFEHLRFEECLRMSDQFLKKMQKSQGKKKITLTDTEYQYLWLTRIGSLAALGHLHEANQLISQKFGKPVVGELSFLFLQICAMAFDRRIPAYVQMISQDKEKKNIDINRYILLSRKFSQLSRIFLSKYAKQKKLSDSFAQIYLEYLQQLQSNSLLSFSFSRDRTLHPNPTLNLKLPSLFLQKFIESFSKLEPPASKQQLNKYRKTERAIANLRIKIAVHEGKADTARKVYREYCEKMGKEGWTAGEIFGYLRSIKEIGEDREGNRVFWCKEFLRVFRENLCLDAYVPIYDYSIEFVREYLKDTDIELSQLADPTQIPPQHLYTHQETPLSQLQNFLNSLYTQYQSLHSKKSDSNYKNKDYYKIAMKNSLLLLLWVLHQGKKYGLVREFLVRYREEYGNKLTFPDQVREYLGDQKVGGFEEWREWKFGGGSAEDGLIGLINYQRIFSINPLKHSYEQNLKQWQRLHELYLTNLTLTQKQKKLEKGQRYLSDQLLTLEADSIRKYTEAAPDLTEEQRQELYMMILGQLQDGVGRSPNNHDLKLRAIYYYGKLNYQEEMLRMLDSLDIKAVQFQTLGYFYLRNLLNSCSWDQNEPLLTRMTKSYQQVHKQSIEYAYKALCSESFNECQENLCYYENIQHSYNFVMLLYVLYLKNRGMGRGKGEYYLGEIMERIRECGVKGKGEGKGEGKGFSLNCDFRVMRNFIDVGLQNICDRDAGRTNYVDFYGIYNNQTVLQNELTLKHLILTLQSPPTPQSTASAAQLRKSLTFTTDLAEIYNFSPYRIFEKELRYKFDPQGMRLHHECMTGLELRLVNWVHGILVGVCDFVAEVRKEGGDFVEAYERVGKDVKEFSAMIMELSWRQQTLFLPKLRIHITEILPLLVHQIQLFTSKKKKPEGQTEKKKLCQQLITLLIDSVTEGIKLKQRLKVDKKYYREIFAHRDQLLERVTLMTGNQFKKIYKVKL